jgi:hypothetical protein
MTATITYTDGLTLPSKVTHEIESPDSPGRLNVRRLADQEFEQGCG